RTTLVGRRNEPRVHTTTRQGREERSMAQTLSRQDVIAAFELSYDFLSARTVLKDVLAANKQDPETSSLDDKQVAMLVQHLEGELPKTQRALDFLNRKTGAAPAKDDKKDAKADDKKDAKADDK